ncbi:MAG: bifunctional anthranilate synthase component I family protein/class IV aminotransferase, partial [Solirubrobacterales bacterium]|nr:bifunctional anthranilate synthase component I family protein/class IV aminotransferase [Solirubrobacterales bacterium]
MPTMLPAPLLQPFRVPLESRLTPDEAVVWLRGDRRSVALVGEWLGGLAILGSEPVRVAAPGDDPFALVDAQPVLAPGGATVGGGWIGWLGYGLGARIERLPPSPPAPMVRPTFSLAFYDHVVVHDGERWWFEGLWSAERDEVLRERRAVWEARLRRAPAPVPVASGPPAAAPGPSGTPAPGAVANGTPAGTAVSPIPTPFALVANGADGHVAAVTACRRRIAAGELYQANLCARLEAGYDGDPIDLFARALPLAQPRFGALVDGVVSLSPERFLRRRGREVRAEPIKGTRPRTGGEMERQLAREELVASSKDAAEHVMIVDLMRNDLGRVCAYGTVRAHPPRVEAHAGVWHLVSTVSGRLRTGVGDGELLRASFPPGSVTGAPKVQAMKVIAALEATRREAYTGAIGIASPIAGLDLNVAIRTFELSRGRVWIGVGGGIVADSDPDRELMEAFDKAAGPVAAIGGRLVRSAPRPARSAPVTPAALRHASPPQHVSALRHATPVRPASAVRHGSRPDPDCGVFETVLVQDGRAVELDRHLDRLAASVSELYGGIQPGLTGVAARANAAAAQTMGRSRLRVLAGADGSVTIDVSPAGPAPSGSGLLVPFALPGGLGAHKWRDRRLLDGLAAEVNGMVPLLVDTDG